MVWLTTLSLLSQNSHYHKVFYMQNKRFKDNNNSHGAETIEPAMDPGLDQSWLGDLFSHPGLRPASQPTFLLLHHACSTWRSDYTAHWFPG